MDLVRVNAIAKRLEKGVAGIVPAMAAAWHLILKAPMPRRCRPFKM